MHALLALALALAPTPVASVQTRSTAPQPADPEAWTGSAVAVDPADRADALFRARRFVEAAEAYQQAYVATDDPVFLDRRAGALFQAGRFAEAAGAFKLAYAATDDPVFLYGRAHALRRAGNCGATIDVLEQFIDTAPPQPDVKEARKVIEECRAVLGESEPVRDPVLGPSLPDDNPDPDPDPGLATQPTRSSPWARDVLGGVLVGAGVFAAVVGGGLFFGGIRSARDRQETEAAFEDRARRVRNLGGAGIGLMAVGGAVLAGGVVRYVVVARRARGATQARAPWVWRF